MRAALMLTACIAASQSLASIALAPASPIVAQRLGLYVVTDDLDRAEAFYQRLFGKPQVRVPGMIGFDVAGGVYAVVDRRKFAATAVRGDTTRGYIKVSDLQAAYRTVAAVVPDSIEGKVEKEGRFGFFRIRDPDGNLIEFYAVDGR